MPYVHPDTHHFRKATEPVWSQRHQFPDSFAYLQTLLTALEQAPDTHLLACLRRNHPRLPDGQLPDLLAADHGYRNWQQAQQARQRIHPAFEQALMAMQQGDLPAFRQAIETQPRLARSHSPFGHGATLWHYAAANGVEISHQAVPEPLPAILRLLRQHQADPHQTILAYGRPHNAFELAETSDHLRREPFRQEVLDLFRPA